MFKRQYQCVLEYDSRYDEKIRVTGKFDREIRKAVQSYNLGWQRRRRRSAAEPPHFTTDNIVYSDQDHTVAPY